MINRKAGWAVVDEAILPIIKGIGCHALYGQTSLLPDSGFVRTVPTRTHNRGKCSLNHGCYMVIFKHLRPIYLADTDAAGVVYFNQLLQICHETYEAWLTDRGLSLQTLIQQGQWAIPLIHAEIDFLAPAYCGDRLEICLQIDQASDHRFVCDYQVQRQQPKPMSLIARAQTQHLCIALPTRQKCSFPPDWRSAIGDRDHPLT